MDRQAIFLATSEAAAHINAKVRERLPKLASKQDAANPGVLVEEWLAEMAVLIDPESAYRALTARHCCWRPKGLPVWRVLGPPGPDDLSRVYV